MRRIFPAAALVAALALTAGRGTVARAAAPEATAVDEANAMFTLMDTDKDGSLTKQEFAAHGMADDFAKADANGDGKVSRDEYVGHAGGMNAMPGM